MEGENSQHIQHVIEANARSTEEFRIIAFKNKFNGHYFDWDTDDNGC
jgi:hypothetical protein